MAKFILKLNDTDVNPYEQFGLTSNPFSQTAITGKILHLQELGGKPIPDTTYIREHLKGYDPEFIEGFVKGKMVDFPD